jgi:hypothetical protein
VLRKLLDFLAGLFMPIVRAISHRGFFSEDQYGNAQHDLQLGWWHIVSGYQGGFYDCVYSRIYYDAGEHIKDYFYWDDNYPDPWYHVKKAIVIPVKRFFGKKPKGNMYCPKCGWGYTETYHMQHCVWKITFKDRIMHIYNTWKWRILWYFFPKYALRKTLENQIGSTMPVYNLMSSKGE